MEDDEDMYEAEEAILEVLERPAENSLTIEYAMYMVGFIKENPDVVPYNVQESVWNYVSRYFNEDIT